jgi:hypothetical protein
MTQNDIFALRMNIARYRTLLKLDIDGEKRSVIERLLAEAEENLASENGSNKQE